MKQIFLLLLGLLFLDMTSTAQEYNNPGEYLGAINAQSVNISKKFLSYTSASAHGKRAKKVESLRMKLLDEVQEARMNIAGMPSFKADKSFRDTAVSFMKLYYNVLNEDYSKIINMEEIAEQSYDAMEAYIMAQEMVSQKLDEANEKMKIAVEGFAAKNNITLTKSQSEMDDMMSQVGKINKYYHQLHLIFFRPYKQEENMLEAMQKNNITGIEQNKSSLLKYAQEGLQKTAAIKAFDGDNSLLAACKTVLNFYVTEANDKMNAVSDFFLTKERFDAIKKEYEKKSSPTKQDVDAYNKSVNDVNKASQSFNNSNQSLSKQRKELLTDWNKAINSFFDQHTPHYK
ncbi:MAG TPA: hypothetical protein VK489_04155 [Ferruginibacter sp.]|nr:hypothetical protein [Ferruginibacter sp.]